jgi:23S rRNA (guanosine2251-2'-O)-methyltransferase
LQVLVVLAKTIRKYHTEAHQSIMILILDNIRSAHNVGSIFRTGDAVGVSEVLLCGVTPDPVDRFGRDRSDISKIALGAEKNIPWRHFSETKEAILFAKEKGLEVVALEQDEHSVLYKNVGVDFSSTALVLGEETKGLSKEILSLVDQIMEIPMSGDKESLNVSVAAGVALFFLRDR